MMIKKQHTNELNIINIASVVQRNRYRHSLKNNRSLSSWDIKNILNLSPDVRSLLGTATDRLNLSARSYFKIIRVARTIADLENSNEITVQHISEALQYRQST